MKKYLFLCLTFIVISSLMLSAKSPCNLVLSNEEKEQIVSWFNNASEETLRNAKLSESLIKNVVSGKIIRPIPNFDAFWNTSGISSGVVKNICKYLDIFKHLDDRSPTKAPIKLRDYDKQLIVNWVNSCSVGDLIRIKVSSAAQKAIMNNRPFRNFKDLWLTPGMSDSNLKKIGIECGAIIWINGSTKIDTVKGIGDGYKAKFNALKIYTTQKLLMLCIYDAWREELARQISAGDVRMVKGLLLRWAKMAHLMRFPQCKEEYANLLMDAKIESSAQLAQYNAADLLAKLKAANDSSPRPVDKLPSINYIQRWIDLARTSEYRDVIRLND